MASSLAMFAGEVQMGRASGAPVGSAYAMGLSSSKNLKKQQLARHSSQSLWGMAMKCFTMWGQRQKNEAARNGAAGIKVRLEEDAEESY
jgi:hypothetical protein